MVSSSFLYRRYQGDDPNKIIASIKGDRFREYRRLYDSASNGKMELSFPGDLSIEVVDYFNYSCPYCIRAIDRGSKKVMSNEVYQKIIDDFVEGNNGLGGISFAYGEPLLDKKLENKVAYALSKGVQDIILSTNAVYLTRERSRSLIESGISKMVISIDAASQEIYSKCRGGDLALVEKHTMEFLDERQRFGSAIPILRMCFVVSPLNEHEIDAFEEKWKDVADFIDFQRMIDFSRRQDLPDFEVIGPIDCRYPFYHIGVSATGRFKPCCSEYGDFIEVGSVEDGDTVVGAFRSEMMEAIRKTFREGHGYHKACKNCIGNIPNSITSGSLLAPMAGKPLGKIPSS